MLFCFSFLWDFVSSSLSSYEFFFSLWNRCSSLIQILKWVYFSFFYFSVLLKIRLVILSLHVLIYSLFIACKTILESSWTSLQFLAPSRWAIKAQNTFFRVSQPLKGCTASKENQQKLLEKLLQGFEEHVYSSIHVLYICYTLIYRSKCAQES